MYIYVPFLSKSDIFFNKSKYVAHRFVTSPHFQEQNTSEITEELDVSVVIKVETVVCCGSR